MVDKKIVNQVTADELQKIMRPDAEISAEQMTDIEELVDALPWFSCGQLLLLKAMKQHGHPFFDTRLAFASLYATDRELLQQYLLQVNSAAENAANETPATLPTDDGFELMDFDEACETLVEIPLSQMDEKLQRHKQNLQEIDKLLALERAQKNALHTTEQPDLVTETLADVYLSQGLVAKAGKVYEQLSLVFPEKKAYFAARFAAAQRAAALSY